MTEKFKLKNLPTGCICLDRLLYGGLPSSQLTVFYGEAATGKTTLALQCSISCVRFGFNVIYLDGDHTFPIERLKQITPDFDVVAQSIGIFTPKNFFEQTLLLEKLELYLTRKTGLIVFDTINNLYRLTLKDSDPEFNFLLNKELNRQLAYLSYLAKTFNIPVLITSQVHAVLQGNQKVEPVATRALNFWSPNIIHLTLTPNPSLRKAILEKLNGRNFSNVFCHFKLSDKGAE